MTTNLDQRADNQSPPEPISDRADLWRHFGLGEKPAERHRLGIEHEKIAVLSTGEAPSYEGTIRELLLRLTRSDAGGNAWQPVAEDGNVVALVRSDSEGRASVTLEPGGQLEISDAPRPSAMAAKAALDVHFAELAEPARELSLRFLTLGFRPFGTLDEVPWMPKGRYRVMRDYLPTRGTRALEMMKRTATVQVNIDFADQPECADKLRVSMGTSSLVTALWANSPLVDGKITDFQSYRAHCWLDTDNDRCGLLPFAFEPRAAEHLYRDYAEWALDVPMFFIYRRGHYDAAHGLTFRRFLDEGYHGERATLVDWELHLSTLFPEVRLKQYLEMRGADSGSREMVEALPALYRGLLYDREARAAAWALVEDWSFEERQALRAAVPREGLDAKVRGQSIAARSRELVQIAREGLMRLGAPEDAALLDPVEEVARSKRTGADVVRELATRFGSDRSRLIEALTLKLE